MNTLKVFVSGTIEDMRAERNAIGDAIESLRLDAVRAETQYSSERSSREECLKMARDCDVYLGVYNPTRYGWTIPNDGISVTEMEFDEAQRHKKATLIFVKKLPSDWSPKNDDEAQQREKQKALLNRVLDFDKGKFRAHEFEALAQLQDEIAGSLMQLLVERFKMTVTRPPFYGVPRNLDKLVGRDAQIAELTHALSRGETALVHGLYGIGGLGKTALAIHIAHKLRNEFDGGVLWADLPTVRPAETLAAWAREYNSDISKIDDVNARADEVRKILQGKRVLAVLDGAVAESDDEKIAPLLRTLADCAVIVTSRVRQLASLCDAKQIDLDRMSEDEAWALFGKHVDPARLNHKRNVIAAIGAVVDFLPLALDLAAAQLREHKMWTPDDVLVMVRDERTRLDMLKYGDGKTRGVRASFDATYKRLTRDEQKFLVGLGAFGGVDFDVYAATYVTEKTLDTVDEVREWLERFQRLSLVQEGRRAFRYKLHPLMRDFARSEEQEANYDLRMAQYYCTVTQIYGPKLTGAEIEDALAILDLELGNIYAGQAWSANDETIGQLDKERWELCRDYIISVAPYFGMRSQWNDWIAWSKSGSTACQKLGDVQGQGAIANNLGIAYRSKGEWDKAIEVHQQALGILEKLDDVHGMAETYSNLGIMYANKGEWDKAVEVFQHTLSTMVKLGDMDGAATCYNNLGLVYQLKGEWDKAAEFYVHALRIDGQVGHVHGMAETYSNLGNIYANKGEWDQAVWYYQQALGTLEKVGDERGMAGTFVNLGSAYKSKGEWDKAIEVYQQALGTLEKLDDVHGMASTFGNLGSVYLKKGKWDKSIEFYNKQLDIAQKLGDVHGQSYAKRGLGDVYKNKGQWDNAIEFYQQALDTLEKLSDEHGMSQIWIEIGTVYAIKGERDKAIEFYQRALDTLEKVGDVLGMASTFGNLGIVYEEQGKIDDAIGYFRKSLEITERLGDIATSSNQYRNLGLLYERQDNIAQAIELMEKAVAIEKKIGHPRAAKDEAHVAELRKKMGEGQQT